MFNKSVVLTNSECKDKYLLSVILCFAKIVELGVYLNYTFPGNIL
jgi:hypothetical protein